MRMLNSAFNDHLPKNSERRKLNLYPPGLKNNSDPINSCLMPNPNEGVYKGICRKTMMNTVPWSSKRLNDWNTCLLTAIIFPCEMCPLKLTSNRTLLWFDSTLPNSFQTHAWEHTAQVPSAQSVGQEHVRSIGMYLRSAKQLTSSTSRRITASHMQTSIPKRSLPWIQRQKWNLDVKKRRIGSWSDPEDDEF